MKPDMRILTLYKEHYMDSYSERLVCGYSCWGYYDGMDIAEVTSNSYGDLVYNAPLGMITKLWYEAGEKTKKISGLYSNQNIGLFRCVRNEGLEEDAEDIEVKTFWQENRNMPFFSVAFLQLGEPNKYYEFSEKVEKDNHNYSEHHAQCRIVSYCTFDNADLVLLVHGNSLTEIEKRLQIIEGMPEVRYQHSILGVSEKYLKDCSDSHQVLEKWDETPCFIDEPVARLDIRLVTSGEQNIIGMEKFLLEKINKKYSIKGIEKAKSSYVVGHANIMITLENTDVKTMLILLFPGSFLRHQNKSYERRNGKDSDEFFPQLYNIETSHILQYENLQALDAHEIPSQFKQTGIPHQWFRKQIAKYRGRAQNALERRDESFYAYYLAVLNTLNTLVQYESFKLSEDIFYLIYPSFNLFDQKLHSALAALTPEQNTNYLELTQVKQSVCDYIEAVNSVIYHTIHTDQIFLMIPGYSGTSFSIPIKLNLAFLWFTNCISQIFSPKDKMCQCIIVPNMESTPKTCQLEFVGDNKIPLIYVKISQRMLYMPRALMIILAHEMGHYIGGTFRCRKDRLDKLKIFTASYLSDRLFPEANLADTNDDDVEKIISILKQTFSEKLIATIDAYVDQLPDFLYYGDDIKKILQCSCRNVLNEGSIIDDVSITKINDQLGEKISQYWYQIYNMLENAKETARDLLIHDTMNDVIFDELTVYRETFSDLVAIELLQCDQVAYDEANCVSEGINTGAKESSRREKVLLKLGPKINWADNDNITLSHHDDLIFKYIQNCEHHLKTACQRVEIQGWLTEIRQLYRCFQKTNDTVSCDKIYSSILHCITKMKEAVDE